MTKTALGLLLGLALTCTAHAQQDDGEDGGYPSLKCLKESVVYGQAANAKNRWGESPQEADRNEEDAYKFQWEKSRPFWASPAYIKNAVNVVYFDRRFDGMSETDVKALVLNDCENGGPGFTYRTRQAFQPVQ
ncbi:hypothetical protein [Caballeronia sp. LjRoot31]|jgi:hypothetical protein|uniref:hypothetical protein n=1 Tax=Caballeronia sp. LjRoot31 TaxID=3342324 RepID=UPI003ECF0069